MPVTKVKVNGEWVPAMPVGGGGEGDMTKAVYDTNDDGVVNAADQATKDGSGNVITSTYAAKATTLSGYGITDAKIQNGSIILGGNSITPLTSFTETDPVFTASAAYEISSSDITNWNGKTSNTGTVTSVRIQATSPVNSSTSTEQTTSLNTTISLANAYGDTKNPYGTKTANYVLAGPTSGSAAVPTFRALTTADIPDLSSTYAVKATTLSGYGITDAYISSGTITLGSNSITPITSHQDISGKVSKSGDTMTGNLAMGQGNLSFTNQSADYGNTITLFASKDSDGQGEYVGYLYVSGRIRISNTPTSNWDVANKKYVDDAISGIDLSDYIASNTTANFTVSDTAPSNPQTGDVWIDMSSDGIPMANGVDF